MMMAIVVVCSKCQFLCEIYPKKKKRKKEVLFLLGLHTLNMKNVFSRLFFVRHSSQEREKRETLTKKQETMWRRGFARARTICTTTNTTTSACRSGFGGDGVFRGGKGSLFCAPCLTSSLSRRGFVSSLLGENGNGIGSNIPVIFLEMEKIKNEVEVEEETNDPFEGLPGYAPPGVDVMLMAVPKAKVTPSRKKRRNQFKRVEFVRDARKCPTCRKPMRSWHNFCCPPKDDEKEDVVYSTTE